MSREVVGLTPVFSRERIAIRVAELGAAIDAVYGEKALVAVCALKGAFIFFSDLVRQIHNPELELDFVRLSSYGRGTSSGRIAFGKDLELDIRNKHVLIVEDIVDTGHTMKFLLDQFSSREPRTLRIAALLDKYERREVDVKVDFAGFEVPDGFLVGYGLDYGEHYRSLPDIYRIELDQD